MLERVLERVPGRVLERMLERILERVLERILERVLMRILMRITYRNLYHAIIPGLRTDPGLPFTTEGKNGLKIKDVPCDCETQIYKPHMEYGCTMIYSQKQKRFLALVFIVILLSPLTFWGLTIALREERVARFEAVTFDTREAGQYAEDILALGPRPAGSKSAASAAGYIRDELEDRGLSCHIENTSVPSFFIRKDPVYHVRVNTSENGEFTIKYVHMEDYLVLLYSGNTFGNKTREVVFAGNGDAYNYTKADAPGEVFLTEYDGTMEYSEMYLNAINASATAHIIVAPDDRLEGHAAVIRDGGNIYTVSDFDSSKNLIPAILMKRSVGMELISLVKNATHNGEYVKMTVNVDSYTARGATMTVVAETDPVRKTEVVAITYYDSFYHTPGAQRGVACPAGLMEIASALAEKKPRYNMRFVFIGACATGPFGLQAYVEANRKELEEGRPDIVFMRGMNLVSGAAPAEIGFSSKSKYSAAREIEDEWKDYWGKRDPSALSRRPELRWGIEDTMQCFASVKSLNLKMVLMDTEQQGFENTPLDDGSHLEPASWKASGSLLASQLLYFSD